MCPDEPNKPRPVDARREPDDDEDDDQGPTDITSRSGLGLPPRPKLRLQPLGFDDDERTDIKRAPVRPVTAALPAGIRATFEAKSGLALGRDPFVITMTRIVIGRGPQSDLRVSDKRMSRSHAIVYYTGEEFRIRDDESGNGTLLNGSRVVEYALRDGDEIVVGESTFVFRLKQG